MPRSTDHPREEPTDANRQKDVAVEMFTQRFGRRPTLAACAPGRINLIGEHTDYNDGFVLPMAIERYTVIVADRALGTTSTFASVELNETASVDLTAPLTPTRGSFINYFLGVADQFARRGCASVNLDVVITSTIPIGAGLSSSAALEVAFAMILEQTTVISLNPFDRAMLCRDAEHAFPGTPCGIMDMLTATMARPDTAMLIDCRTLNVKHISMPSSEEVSVLVIDTGVKHELASSQYAMRRGECEEAANVLRVSSLRDASLAMMRDKSLPTTLRKRAEHVVAENSRTVHAAQALAADNLQTLGDLLFAGHDSLRDLYEVSCPELDVLVEAARDLHGSGVFGARMTGGGFGGCVIVLCRPNTVNHISEYMTMEFAKHFRRRCAGFTTMAAGAACRLSIEP